MSEHTPGVMRAAKRIWTNEGTLTKDRIAAIIEQETGLAELLDACEVAVGFVKAECTCHQQGKCAICHLVKKMDAAIAKARTVQP